jgi:hypothetical protein
MYSPRNSRRTTTPRKQVTQRPQIRKAFTPEIKEQYNEVMGTYNYSKPAEFK